MVAFLLVAVFGGILLWLRRDRFDGQTPLTTRGVFLYGMTFCVVMVVLGVIFLVGLALGAK